jgi:uncharacterized repeat protein (TIGR02543 family)
MKTQGLGNELLAGLSCLLRTGGVLSPGKAIPAASRRTVQLATLTGLLAVNLATSIAWAQAAYTVTDLGTLGGSSSFALGINASGQVVGRSDLADGNSHAFLYSDSTMYDLGAMGGNSSLARAINDSGQVVGSASPGDSTGHAFLYSDSVMADLGRSSDARGINASGQVVGKFETAGAGRAFLYSGSSLVDLGTLGGRDSDAFGINTSGHVVGNSRKADETQRAFLYANSRMTDLGTLGGVGSSYATAINDNGQVVGGADVDDRGTSHAFRCDAYAASIMHDLGCLGGAYNYSRASAINAIGQVVGASSFDDTGAAHAFIYSSTMTDLNDLIDPLSGWMLYEATGINDAGQIVGNGVINGQAHAFLLTPRITVIVTFEGAGVAIFPSSRTVVLDEVYGPLPVPTRSNHTFDGWWTGINGSGTEVTESTIVSTAGNHTIFANWLQHQLITFPLLPAKTYGAADFPPGATASSGLPVTYASDNPAVATIAGGNVHIVGVGSATITASQSGNGSWNAATPVPRTLTVVTPPLTDLTVSKIKVTPSKPLDATAFTAEVTVKNAGKNASLGGVLTLTPAIGAAGITQAVPALAKSKSVVLMFTVPGQTPGTKKMTATLSAVPGETKTTNNSRTANYTVTARPDFAVTAVAFSPVTPLCNGTFTAYVTILNNGGAAKAGYLEVWINYADGQVATKSVAVSTISAGKTKRVTVTKLLVGAGLGERTFRAVVDGRNTAVESDESNNVFSTTYTPCAVTPPPPPPG